MHEAGIFSCARGICNLEINIIHNDIYQFKFSLFETFQLIFLLYDRQKKKCNLSLKNFILKNLFTAMCSNIYKIFKAPTRLYILNYILYIQDFLYKNFGRKRNFLFFSDFPV